MTFWTASADTAGLIDSGTIEILSPAPTYVEYPDRFDHTIKDSQDGNPVIQAPLVDNRPRRWIWTRYRPDTRQYSTTFDKLWNLHWKLRLEATPAKSEWVYLKEDVTGNLDKRVWNAGQWEHQNDFVRVKVVDVTQNVAREGGTVKYDETVLEFLIDDSAWTNF